MKRPRPRMNCVASIFISRRSFFNCSAMYAFGNRLRRVRQLMTNSSYHSINIVSLFQVDFGNGNVEYLYKFIFQFTQILQDSVFFFRFFLLWWIFSDFYGGGMRCSLTIPHRWFSQCVVHLFQPVWRTHGVQQPTPVEIPVELYWNRDSIWFHLVFIEGTLQVVPTLQQGEGEREEEIDGKRE